jgi:hypothetical protein
VPVTSQGKNGPANAFEINIMRTVVGQRRELGIEVEGAQRAEKRDLMLDRRKLKRTKE